MSECVDPAPAVTCAAPAPVVEYVAPAPAEVVNSPALVAVEQHLVDLAVRGLVLGDLEFRSRVGSYMALQLGPGLLVFVLAACVNAGSKF